MSTNDTLRGLLPCPFCGGEAAKEKEGLSEVYGYADRVTYRCKGCGCTRGAQGISGRGYADNSTVEDRALEAWNSRAPLPAVEAAEIEVVGTRYSHVTEAGHTVRLVRLSKKKRDGWDSEDLMTVAQHRRILAGANQQAGSGWIAVSERLPESGKPVSVWCEGAEQPGLAWISRHPEWSGEWVIPEPQAIGYESITHWMPLPPSPAAKAVPNA